MQRLHRRRSIFNLGRCFRLNGVSSITLNPAAKHKPGKWAILMVLQKASLPKMADRLQRTMNAGVKIQ
jgi:hypothetical protein